MKYPRMLFPQGDTAQPDKIVHSADEEAEARKAGYRIAYEAAEVPEAPQPPKAPAKTPKGK